MGTMITVDEGFGEEIEMKMGESAREMDLMSVA